MPEPAEPSTPSEPVPPSAPVKQRASRPALSEFREFAIKNARILVAAAMLVFGIVLVVLGWYGAAHTNVITEQIPYLISGGLLGLGLIIVSGILATSAMQERSTDELRNEVARAIAAAVPYSAEHAPAPASSNGKNVIVVAGGRSYHEAGCPLIEGKENAKELVPARAASEGYAPCKLCGPD